MGKAKRTKKVGQKKASQEKGQKAKAEPTLNPGKVADSLIRKWEKAWGW